MDDDSSSSSSSEDEFERGMAMHELNGIKVPVNADTREMTIIEAKDQVVWCLSHKAYLIPSAFWTQDYPMAKFLVDVTAVQGVDNPDDYEEGGYGDRVYTWFLRVRADQRIVAYDNGQVFFSQPLFFIVTD